MGRCTGLVGLIVACGVAGLLIAQAVAHATQEVASTPTASATSDTPSFARQIAPVLIANCNGCHNPGDQARRGQLDLASFQGLMAGGSTGPAVVAGKPEESTLLLRVRGDEEPRMPPGDRRLAPATIERIERWIAAGAPLDEGLSPTAALVEYAPSPEELRVEELAAMQPEERDQLLQDTGRALWERAADGEPFAATGQRVLLLSRFAPDVAEPLVQTLDRVAQAMGAILGPAAGGSLKGPEKILVIVLPDRAAYVEFARGVENSPVDPAQPAHLFRDGKATRVIAYEPGLPDAPGADATETAATRLLAAPLSEALGDLLVSEVDPPPPRWLSLGLGGMHGVMADPRGPRSSELRRTVAALLQRDGLPWVKALLEGQGDSTEARAVGFSILEWLYRTRRGDFTPFVRAMLPKDAKLEDVLDRGFNAKLDEFLQAWASDFAARYGRGPRR